MHVYNFLKIEMHSEFLNVLVKAYYLNHNLKCNQCNKFNQCNQIQYDIIIESVTEYRRNIMWLHDGASFNTSQAKTYH